MTNRSPKSSNSRSSMFTISLILGLLLIPLSAVAAAAVISKDEAPPAETEAVVAVAEVPSSTVTTTEAETIEPIFITEPPAFTRADLEAACGAEGLELVARETAGTATDLEEAALNALREICADEGLELPGALELPGDLDQAGPPAEPGVARTVKAPNRPASAAVDSATTTTMAQAVLPQADATAPHDADQVADPVAGQVAGQADDHDDDHHSEDDDHHSEDDDHHEEEDD